VQRICFFGENVAEGDAERKELWGGKGASLAVMCRAGLPVPPGFTISVECCREYLERTEREGAAAGTDRWPVGLEEDVSRFLERLEKTVGRKFGEGAEPLLVSVRSGAAVSMPGMMDTILNCGLHPGLAQLRSNPETFWHAYAQFVLMFAKTVAEIPEARFDQAADAVPEGEERQRRTAEVFLALYERTAGRPFPKTPWLALVECINAVFNSWLNQRAVIYRKHHDIRGLHGTAVTVQAMFPSEKSGVGFTVNPNAPEADEIVIESSYGLGEAIVSGAVTPDRFVLDRRDLRLKSAVLGDKRHVTATLDETVALDPNAASLTPPQLQELAQLALKIENYFQVPVDFEWGFAHGRFSLLQSRPIRGLEIAKDVETGRRSEIVRLQKLIGEKRNVWVAHNLSETLESPTPLTWDVIRHFMSGDGGFGRMYRDFGYQPSARVLREGFLELICGRIYADPERTAELFWEGMPLAYDLDEIVRDPGLLEAAPGKFVADKADGGFLLRVPRLIYSLIVTGRRMGKARSSAVESFNRRLPAYQAYLDEKRDQDLRASPTGAVIAELHGRIARVLDEFGKESLKPGFFGGLARGALETSLTQLMGKEKGAELCNALTSGLDGNTTMEENVLLFNVAHGKATMAEFLKRFGHRTVGEMELAVPRRREDPSPLERMLESYRGASVRSPEELHAANRERRLKAERELPEVLAAWGGSSQREDFEDLMREAQTLLPYREIGKHWLMMGYELIRAAVMELSRRWDLGRDVFFLKLDELEKWEAESARLKSELATRKIRWESARRLEHPRVIDSEALDELGLPRTLAAEKELKGVPLAAGLAIGTAKIVYDPAAAGDLGRDCILICPSTDPGWTALFVHIKGLVVERGGTLSHGAITARDFGIPAVACSDATKLIPDGAKVRVDGNRGTAELLESEEKA
jgi:pyruvate,water dikinase